MADMFGQATAKQERRHPGPAFLRVRTCITHTVAPNSLLVCFPRCIVAIYYGSVVVSPMASVTDCETRGDQDSGGILRRHASTARQNSLATALRP